MNNSESNNAVEEKLTAIEGLYKLAFCRVNDAVKILLKAEELDTDEIGELDLFPVSEIRQVKDGGLEIKFCDRLKVFEMLINYTGQGAAADSSFYGALESAAKSVRDAGGV